MLFGTASAIATVKLTEENACVWATRMALIESFTMHARVLVDFLYGSKSKSDDVVAEDFFDDPSCWVLKRPKMSELLETIHRRVGKEVAHLTYVRLDVTPEKKRWRISDIANDVHVVLKKFVELVPESRVGNSVRMLISSQE